MKETNKVSPEVRATLIEAGYTQDEVDLISDFGKRLRILRIKSNIRQSDLAKEMGVVNSAIGKYEGKVDSYPSIEVLLKLSKFFNVSTDYLLKGKDDTHDTKNNINSDLNNRLFVQENNSGFIMHGKELSPEVAELVRMYDKLSGGDRLKLLKYAIELEDKSNEIELKNKKRK